jgi:hypothetical protein
MRLGYNIIWQCETARGPQERSRRTLAIGVPVSSRAIIIISPVARSGVDGTFTRSRTLLAVAFLPLGRIAPSQQVLTILKRQSTFFAQFSIGTTFDRVIET